MGHLGVNLFFVLSGFLITYLLLAEEKLTGIINVKYFYVRRMLRIWPLYYFVIIMALFILPHISFFTFPNFSKAVVMDNLGLKTILYFTFFSNLALVFLGLVPYAAQTWSIGTEEQFYLIWPILVKYFKHNRLWLMLGVIVFYIALKFLLSKDCMDFLPYKNIALAFWKRFSIDCMAIGGFYAVLSFQGSKSLNVLLNNYLFYLALVTIIAIVVIHVYFWEFYGEIYSVLFGLIILNFATNNSVARWLENRTLDYLGRISYGLYMLHVPAIVITLKIAMWFSITSNYFIVPLSFVLTILLASISYKFFETRFLRYKVKFSEIISG